MSYVKGVYKDSSGDISLLFTKGHTLIFPCTSRLLLWDGIEPIGPEKGEDTFLLPEEFMM